jgi:hypothetical protein
MVAYWLMLVHRMRQKLGRRPSAGVDTVIDEYSRRKPCRRERLICCA